MALFLVVHTPRESSDEWVQAPTRLLDLARDAGAEGVSPRWLRTWTPEGSDDRIFSLWEAEEAGEITTALTRYGYLDHMAAQPLRVQEWGPAEVLAAADEEARG